MKRVNNQNGSVMVQVMLASAVLVIIAVGSMTISSTLLSQDKALIYKQNLDGFSSLVSAMINDDQFCTPNANFMTGGAPAAGDRGIQVVGTFNAATAATANGVELELRLPQYSPDVSLLPALNFKRFTSSALAGDRTAGDLGLIIDSVRFANATLLPSTATPPENLYEGDLVILASSSGGVLIPSMKKNVGKVKLRFDSANTYLGCGAGVSASDLCLSLGGVYHSSLSPACRFGVKEIAPCPTGQIITDVTTASDGTVNRVCANADLVCPNDASGNPKFLMGINREGPLGLSPRLTCAEIAVSAPTCPLPYVTGGLGQAHSSIPSCACPNVGEIFDGTNCVIVSPPPPPPPLLAGVCNPAALALTSSPEATVIATGLCSSGTAVLPFAGGTSISGGISESWTWQCVGTSTVTCGIPCGPWAAGQPRTCSSGYVSSRFKRPASGFCAIRCHR